MDILDEVQQVVRGYYKMQTVVAWFNGPCYPSIAGSHWPLKGGRVEASLMVPVTKLLLQILSGDCERFSASCSPILAGRSSLAVERR
jgi:hypothetical protein